MCQARRTIRTSLSHRLISDFFCSRFFATARPGAFGPARQPNVRSALLTWALTTCLDIQCLKLSRWLRWEFYKIFKDLRTRRDPYRTRWWTPAAPSISAAQFILHNVSCPRSTLWHGQFALLCIMQQLQIYQRAYTSLPNVRVHNHHNPFPSLAILFLPFPPLLSLSVPDDLPFLFAVACCGAVSGTWGVDRQFRATCWQLQHYLYFSPVWDSRATSSDIIAVLCLKSRVLASI